MTQTLGARIVVAGTHSGVGKTTIATGLMAAFAATGTSVAAAKVGPDFIDPGYHAVATGRPPRNLDPWICGVDAIGPLSARAAAGSELLVVEGVMGLFDGAVDGEPSSTADVAALLRAPVVLVVDGSAMSASVAALVRGFRDHRTDIDLAGVILNRVGGEHHRTLLVEALESIDVPVLGAVGQYDELSWRDRHLGLVPVVESSADVATSIERLGATIARACDLEQIRRLSDDAPPLQFAAPPQTRRIADRPVRIGVAGGRAFSFVYQDNLDSLAAAGAELVAFDPMEDERLPTALDGLIVGGGFPEVYVAALAANTELLTDTAERVRGGLITWAECGGLLWLARSLDDQPMGGTVATEVQMTDRLTLGYRHATALRTNPVIAVGDTVRGHEFHYSSATPAGDALGLVSRFGERTEGFATPTLLATYLHQHLGARPDIAERFVDACTLTSAHR
ncbi:MAG: cobyrinate a,c-diamide synthase [Actinomycetota bacterium]